MRLFHIRFLSEPQKHLTFVVDCLVYRCCGIGCQAHKRIVCINGCNVFFLWHGAGKKRNATLRQRATVPYGPRLPQKYDWSAMLRSRLTQTTSANQSD